MTDDFGKVLLVGCGNMGGAMVRGWIADGAAPAAITAIDPFAEPPAPGVRIVRAAGELAGETADLLLLAVKPQQLDAVAPDVAPLVGPQTVLLSILAGVEIDALRRRSRRQALLLAATALTAGLALLLAWQPKLLEFLA